MIALIVYRPELRTDVEWDESPFTGYEIVGVCPNHFEADALMSETIARARYAGQNPGAWQWSFEPVPERQRPEFTWNGWFTAEDSGDGDVPDGEEWLSILEDGEEYAVIVLRTKASIFDGKPDDLAAARVAREIRAETIVRSLNAAVERGEFPT